jgi:hypothetical protein
MAMFIPRSKYFAVFVGGRPPPAAIVPALRIHVYTPGSSRIFHQQIENLLLGYLAVTTLDTWPENAVCNSR